jgi:hypothetical protein
MAVGFKRPQLLPSTRTADLSEDGETLDSDDDDLPSVKQILASSKRVIDLTGGGDDDGESSDGDFTEVGSEPPERLDI